MTQDNWLRLTRWPLTVVALVFLAAYSVQVIVDPAGTGYLVTEAVLWITWALFAIDYVVLLLLAKSRGRWFATHLFDLAVVVLPMLRPLRLLRVVTLLNVLQRSAAAAFRGRVILYAATASALLVYVAALAVLDAERGQGGQINDFQSAIWWAFVTITTVGYGDYFPVTLAGRFVAVGVMIGGIALIGIVTATLASWIVERVSEEIRADSPDVHRDRQVEELAAEIRQLREALQAHERRPGT